MSKDMLWENGKLKVKVPVTCQLPMTEVTGLPPVVFRRVRLSHKRLLGLFLSGSRAPCAGSCFSVTEHPELSFRRTADFALTAGDMLQQYRH